MLVGSSYLYMRVAQYILDLIESQELKPGDQLDSERNLSARLGVNRLTVRKGIEMLVAQGVLRRVPSKGTFVADPKIDQRADQVLGFSDQVLSSGLQPGAKVLDVVVVPATKQISRELKVEVGTPLWCIQRLRFANGEAVCIEHSHYPTSVCPGINEHDLSQSLYRIFKDKYNFEIKYVRQTLEAVAATHTEAELLRVNVKDPLMLVVRVGYDQAGQPVEFANEWYRGDRCRFVILGEGPADTQPSRDAFVTKDFLRKY